MKSRIPSRLITSDPDIPTSKPPCYRHDQIEKSAEFTCLSPTSSTYLDTKSDPKYCGTIIEDIT